MNRFYFNECLPRTYNASIQDVFETTIRNFSRLTKDATLNIEKSIITHKMPSAISICNTNLKCIIDLCRDKELRKVAYSFFTKYPIDEFYKIDDVFDDESINTRYAFEGHDAINLAVAHKMGWIVLSLPLSASLEMDMLHVNEGENHTCIHNWHGANTQYIVSCIGERVVFRDGKVLELKYCFGEKECILSDSFCYDYTYSPTNLQELIIKKFGYALRSNLLFPARSNDELIKICTGLGNEKTYELRSKAFGGMRVYFSCDEECIYIGGMGTKASSIGKEQSADISRASSEILKLKSS